MTRLAGATVAGALAAALALWACRANPSIDGAKIPPIGSEAAPPKCPDLCERLAKLCGYAPVGCVDSCANYDEDHRACVGQAASCQSALQDCTNAETPEAGDDDGGGADEGGAADDAGDAASE